MNTSAGLPVPMPSTPEPWWYYLPLLLAFSLPWVTLLPVALRRAWQNRRQASIGFLLLWLLLPLAFFSLARTVPGITSSPACCRWRC